MGSGEARAPRGKARGRDELQGSLEGILEEDEERPSPDEAAGDGGAGEAPAATPPAKAQGRRAAPPAKGDGNDPNPLRSSLDTLEENIKLLLARHEEVVEAQAAAEQRRRSGESLDPVALRERVTALEAETERLERHAAFLEDRVRGLLSRVRYVIES